MAQQVVLASGNIGKLKELQNALSDFGVELIPQNTFNVTSAVEDGLSFIENAIIKARHASKITGLPALADDSGLEVEYLKGAPGIYSARYAGEEATDAQNNAKLLSELDGVPVQRRRARFHCYLAYVRHWQDPTPIICQGQWQGQILDVPMGEGGFGYDPIFFDAENAVCPALLSKEEKNKLSHRGKAISLLRDAFSKR